MLNRNTWNYLIVWKKMSSGCFKNVIYKMCLEIIYSIWIKRIWHQIAYNGWCAINQNKPNPIYLTHRYKQDLTLTYNGWYAIKPNQTKPNPIYLIYMYKPDLALNSLQWLIYHITKPNQSIFSSNYIIKSN